MAVTFYNIQPNLLPGNATCGLCKQPLKPASTTQSPGFKPRHNKHTPRTVVRELPSPGSSPVISQVQKIVGHGNCFFHKPCLDRHLVTESTCYSCKSRVVVPLSEAIIKETLKVIGAGVLSYSRSLLGAGLAIAPEAVMRISLTACSVLEANGFINPVFYHFASPAMLPILLRTTVFAFLIFGVDPLSNKIHLPSFLSDTQKKIILYAGTIFTFPFICNYWRANAIMGNAFMAKNAVVDTIKKDGLLSIYPTASLVGVLGSMLTLRSLIF